ncbi:TonB family protein [Sphingomonas aracearum]|uniref:TonB family protein n=1 Tax=Sphingomonas aracearum TaxID=2283317 RepID=A0A369VXI5_9SPHN|nr:TonB family protein [Sphingomonas aracearum]RDE06549.1 TonB family protein [Sphingomonas aracearum]
MTTTRYQAPSRARLPAAAAALALPAALLWVLSGQSGRVGAAASETLKTFVVAPEPPPPAPEPQPRRATPRKEGASAPPNLRAKPKEIVAPKPEVVPPPPPVLAPTIASTGAEARAGAAPVAGPGTGAGGEGEGLGSGGQGNGTGGGGGGTPWEQVAGIRDGDWPAEAKGSDATGTVGVRFVIGVNGRLTSCAVTRSSGDAALDRGTCPLLVKRLRFRPERDAAGRPVPATVNGTQEWFER